jgi:hypothetical protein
LAVSTGDVSGIGDAAVCCGSSRAGALRLGVGVVVAVARSWEWVSLRTKNVAVALITVSAAIRVPWVNCDRR